MRAWKHHSTHPLTNALTLVDSGIVTRSKFKNIITFTTYICMVEPKNIKEELEDVDYIVAMQEELNKFERNKV